MTRGLSICASSNNVFRNLGFPEAEAQNLLLRGDLVIHIRKVIDKLGITLAEAANKDFIENLRPNSLKVLTAFVKPSLAAARAYDKFQFKRHGYFVANRVNHATAKPTFNLAVELKDSWGK